MQRDDLVYLAPSVPFCFLAGYSYMVSSGRASTRPDAEDCCRHPHRSNGLPEQTLSRYSHICHRRAVVLGVGLTRSPRPASCSVRRSRRLPATSACTAAAANVGRRTPHGAGSRTRSKSRSRAGRSWHGRGRSQASRALDRLYGRSTVAASQAEVLTIVTGFGLGASSIALSPVSAAVSSPGRGRCRPRRQGRDGHPETIRTRPSSPTAR